MPTYTPPIREMQFVLHELLDVSSAYREMPRHAEINRELVEELAVDDLISSFDQCFADLLVETTR